MELGTGINDRYKKITFWKEGVDELLVNMFLESHDNAPAEIVLDMDTTDLPCMASRKDGFSMATTTTTATCRCTFSAEITFCARE